MAACTDLIGSLGALLDPASYNGKEANGLHIPSRDETQSVATA
jgi:hypothetical protein